MHEWAHENPTHPIRLAPRNLHRAGSRACVRRLPDRRPAARHRPAVGLRQHQQRRRPAVLRCATELFAVLKLCWCWRRTPTHVPYQWLLRLLAHRHADRLLQLRQIHGGRRLVEAHDVATLQPVSLWMLDRADELVLWLGCLIGVPNVRLLNAFVGNTRALH